MLLKEKKLVSEYYAYYEQYRELWLAKFKHHNHRGKMLEFNKLKYLKGIYADKSRYKVVIKSTQCGISEYLHIYTFSKCSQGRSVFYVLPTYDLMLTVVQNRIDKEIAFTEYYKQLIKDSHGKSDSAKMKHIGEGVVKFVGSNTPNAFIEFPADEIIIDEMDNCDQENILMANERLGMATDPGVLKVGNPTIPDFGISKEYDNSNEQKWLIKCKCGNWFNPDFFKHIVRKISDADYEVIDSKFEFNNINSEPHLICNKCNKPVDKFSEGEWVAHRDSHISGYHISKLFSSMMSNRELLDKFILAETNPGLMQRFYNADLGLPYINQGDKINLDILNACKSNYRFPVNPKGICIMGVDVGDPLCNVIVGEIVANNKIKLIWIGTVRSEADIISKAREYGVKFGVIDARPEGRMSKRVSTILKGFFRCQYVKTLKESIDVKYKIISSDRTTSLDTVKEYLITDRILFPENAETIDGFYEQMEKPIRVWSEKANDYAGAYNWIGKPDHFFHCLSYLIMAFKLPFNR